MITLRYIICSNEIAPYIVKHDSQMPHNTPMRARCEVCVMKSRSWIRRFVCIVKSRSKYSAMSFFKYVYILVLIVVVGGVLLIVIAVLYRNILADDHMLSFTQSHFEAPYDLPILANYAESKLRYKFRLFLLCCMYYIGTNRDIPKVDLIAIQWTGLIGLTMRYTNIPQCAVS